MACNPPCDVTFQVNHSTSFFYRKETLNQDPDKYYSTVMNRIDWNQMDSKQMFPQMTIADYMDKKHQSIMKNQWWNECFSVLPYVCNRHIYLAWAEYHVVCFPSEVSWVSNMHMCKSGTLIFMHQNNVCIRRPPGLLLYQAYIFLFDQNVSEWKMWGW